MPDATPNVRRLVGGQFPQWAGLPVTEVAAAGTDNRIFRLGDDMVVRLPRHEGSAVEREFRWLPILAPHLPLAVPVPLALGVPTADFPYPWAVHTWLPGEPADPARIDLGDAAAQLGRFVAALRDVDATGGPRSYRGGPVPALDDDARRRIRDLHDWGFADERRILDVWEAAVAAPMWQGAPVWIHSDLYAANLLSRDGRLSAVIDFGALGTGDPAVDMLPAWAVLTAGTRDAFRAASRADDATWDRGKGWAVAFGVGALHYYHATNPVLAGAGRRCLDEAAR